MKFRQTKIEMWKLIPGYEGYYEASNWGNIRSLDRVIKCRNNYDRNHQGKILKQVVSSSGYQMVALSKLGRVERYNVSRLLLLAFVGSCPKGMEGCHNDGGKLNNRLTNLRWDTRKNNNADKVKHGTYLSGEKLSWTKLIRFDVRNIRNEYANGGVTQRELGIKFGVDETTIGRIIRNETWVNV